MPAETLLLGAFKYERGFKLLMGRHALYCFYYYTFNFNYAFYTRGLNIQAQFNFKSCPIPYELLGGYTPVIISPK